MMRGDYLAAGAELISIERTRQILMEGYTDDGRYVNSELARAAGAYIANVVAVQRREHARAHLSGASSWPWGLESFKPSDDPIRTLVKAGALIAAEIDRLQAMDD